MKRSRKPSRVSPLPKVPWRTEQGVVNGTWRLIDENGKFAGIVWNHFQARDIVNAINRDLDLKIAQALPAGGLQFTCAR